MDRVRRDAPQHARVEWRWPDAAPSSAPRGKTAPGGARAATDHPITGLSKTIETFVIPRLISSLAGTRARSVAPCPDVAMQAEIERLLGLVLERDFAGAPACVARIRARGETFETLCVDWLAPVARRLGVLWDQDQCGFAEVTLGMWRLQHVLHELRNASPATATLCERRARALLIPVPGGQHMLGLAIVTECFRRAGWDVSGSAPMGMSEVSRTVREGRYDVAGVSASCTSQLDAVAACIRMIRRSSRNKSIAVMVGGPAFADDSTLALSVGADAMARDARRAVGSAERLLSRRARQTD